MNLVFLLAALLAQWLAFPKYHVYDHLFDGTVYGEVN